jgi:hypothetical protein
VIKAFGQGRGTGLKGHQSANGRSVVSDERSRAHLCGDVRLATRDESGPRSHGRRQFDIGDRDSFDRISTRAAAFNTEPVSGELRVSARVQADRDYMANGIRIAERL